MSQNQVEPEEVEVLIQEFEGRLGLFSPDSPRQGRIGFSSIQGDVEVSFDGDESPFQNVPESFLVPANTGFIATLRDDIPDGTKFPFTMQSSSGISRGVVGVFDGPKEIRTSFRVGGVPRVQMVGKQDLLGEVLVHVRNMSDLPVEIQLELLNDAMGDSTPLQIPAQGEGVRSFVPQNFGLNVRLLLSPAEAGIGGEEAQTGGTEQAEVLIFPPP